MAMRYGYFDSEITGVDSEGMPIIDRAETSELFCLLFCLHHRYHNSAGSTVQNTRHVSPRKLCHSYNRRKTSSISKQNQVCQLIIRKRTMFAVIKDKIHSSLLCNQRHGRTVHRLDKHTF